MDITTVNLDHGQATPDFIRNQSRVKFEMVNYPYEPPKKKGSILGKFFKAIGAVGMPVGFALAPFTAGMSAIFGWGAYGLSAVGAKADATAKVPNLSVPAAPLAYPGLSSPVSGYQGNLIAPASFSSGDPALDLVVSSRDNAMTSAIHR